MQKLSSDIKLSTSTAWKNRDTLRCAYEHIHIYKGIGEGQKIIKRETNITIRQSTFLRSSQRTSTFYISISRRVQHAKRSKYPDDVAEEFTRNGWYLTSREHDPMTSWRRHLARSLDVHIQSVSPKTGHPNNIHSFGDRKCLK